VAGFSVIPSAPTSLAEAGLNFDLVQQLLLKTLYFSGELTGTELTKRLGLVYSVLDPCLEFLKQQHLCEISGGSSFGGASYNYRISETGRTRAARALEQSQYVGLAPVPLSQYYRYMTDFKQHVPLDANRERVRQAFSHLVVSDDMIDQMGTAVNSGNALFLYGSSGNGKTVLARAIQKLLVSDMAVPHALEVEGNIVRVFDPVNHEQVAPERDSQSLTLGLEADGRWVRCKRPLVMVGGELTLDQLDLRYDATSGFYRAPIQMVSGGGILVIDDFGRQHCSPRDILNRWIVPLESQIDFLSLASGQAFEVPFMTVVIFATNLKPTDLADEAFLRRIQYKIYAESPTIEVFTQIFENYCRSKELPFEREIVDYLVIAHFRPNNIALRGCQPRDLIDHALAFARYTGQPRRLTPALMDAACKSYFVLEQEIVATHA
jgi:energy-coupling factor transporter ATP-binding protein EcfA2